MDTESTLEKLETTKGRSEETWRSFPKVPNLLQYVSTGTYYARVMVNGKDIRRSLKTPVFTTAKLRLIDFIKEETERRSRNEPISFSEAAEIYERRVKNDASIKASSKTYRLYQCLGKIKRSWPELWTKRLDEIQLDDCLDWANELNEEISSSFYNNTISTLRHVLDIGIEESMRRGSGPLENPADKLSKTRVHQSELKLPERSQFDDLVKNIALKSGGWGPRIADYVQFLAYGGLRAFSEAQWVNWEDIDWQRKEIIVRGNPETRTKNSEIRRVPIIKKMEELLIQMKAESSGNGKIVQICRCDEALARACNEIGIPRITHHGLRHLFATRCIESGVDIPTVARWLGHKDGGALAMRTYGHLRNEHSQAMAAKVKF